MRKRSLFFGVVAIFYAALIFSGCEQSEGGGPTPLPQVGTPTADIGGSGGSSVLVAIGTEVALGTATDGAAIYYTLNGDNPTADSTLYTDGDLITISDSAGTVTLKAIAVKAGMSNSGALTVVYTVDADAVAVPTAKFSDTDKWATGGAVSEDAEITVTGPEGTTIHYTKDNNDPTAASDTVGADPIKISDLWADEETASVTLKVIAVGEGDTPKLSAIRMVTYRKADVTWTATQVGGEEDEADSTGILFTFTGGNAAGLAKENITITPAGKVTLGDPTQDPAEGHKWTLPLTWVDGAQAGDVSVKIRLGDIDTVPQTVALYRDGTPNYTITIDNTITGGAGLNVRRKYFYFFY